MFKHGFMMIPKDIYDLELWKKPPLYLKVWIYLFIKAQHSPYKSLKEGELHTSLEEIAEGVSWFCGYRKEKPHRRDIFRIIDYLREEHKEEPDWARIETKKTPYGIRIKLSHYNDFRDSGCYDD